MTERIGPQEAVERIREALLRLSRAATLKGGEVDKLTEEIETASVALAFAGLSARSIVELIGTVIHGVIDCERCHARGEKMHGPVCGQCAFELRKIQESRQFA